MFSFFERRIDPFPPEPPQQPPQSLFAFAWHYTRNIWPWLVATSILIASISILQVVLFGFLGNIVDWLSVANRETFLADQGTNLLLMALVTVVVLPALGAMHSLIMNQTIYGNYPMVIRWKAHRYLLGQSLGFYQEEFAGRIATKVMQGALGVREMVIKVLDVFAYVSVYFLAALVLVSTFDIWLMAPFVAWLIYYSTMMTILLPKLAKISERQADARSEMTGRVVDSYTNIMTVKLFAHAGHEEEYARKSMNGFLDTVYPQMRISTILNVGLDIGNSLLLFGVAAIGLWSWLNGDAGIGAMAVAIGLALRLEGMSHWIMWELSALFENIGMAHDGMTTIAQPQKVLDRRDAASLARAGGEIEFDAIRFHYGKDEGVIDNLSLSIAPGEKIGLVGRSGAGKTTLTNLLLRFYDLEGGHIRVDGKDIGLVSQESLRRNIGVVTQDTSLLHRSIRENIGYGRPSATDAEIVDAARRAKALEFIETLEDQAGRTGLDAHVGERGVKLSGGQRQRIAIARVFLKDAPILVLDEATSALDSEVEAAIQENLFDLMEGKTVIAIAHRLSTIAQLDRLVVMDKGRIVETGSHSSLVEKDGLYGQLWARQSGGFICPPEQAAAE